MKIRGFKDTIEWYDKNASFYAKSISESASLKDIEEFTSLIAQGGEILDAGCAAGRDSYIFSRMGFKVIGIDLSEELIKIAKAKYPNIKFIVGNLLKLPFKNNEFDGVWARSSLLHLEKISEVKKALKEFYRVLKNTSALFVLVKAQTSKQKTGTVSDKISKHKRYFRYFTKREIRELLETSGFEIINIIQFNETERYSTKRPEVEWILSLSRKVT